MQSADFETTFHMDVDGMDAPTRPPGTQDAVERIPPRGARGRAGWPRANCLISAMLCVAGCAASHVPPSPSPNPPRTQIVILGSGTPIADPERQGPSVAIVVDGVSYIVDAGAGVVRRGAATKIEALRARNMKLVFLTHLHSDHTLGYPDLLLSGAVLHRGAPLVAYGPHGLRDMTDHLLAAWKKDIELRVNGLERGDAQAYAVDVHEVAPGVVYRDDKVTVRAFLVKHGSWDEAFGYRFDGPDRSIVFSGDTAPTDAVVEACNGCDVLIHEVYSRAGFETLPPGDQRYHAAFHTSAPELAALAAKARVKTLVLHHQLFFGQTESELIDEVRRGFRGNVVSAHDLQTL
jgi:ribonuclease BN (tRNA processing enzyme)